MFRAQPGTPLVVEPIGELQVVQRAKSTEPSAGEAEEKNPSEDKQAPAPDVDVNSPDIEAASSARAPLFESATGISSAQSAAPFSMEIAQSFYKDDSLQLRIHLRSTQPLPSSEIAVEAVGLAHGEVLSRDIAFLDRVIANPVLEPNKKVSIMLSLADRGIEEYQVRGMWGQDTRTRRAKLTSPSAVQEEKTPEEQQPAEISPAPLQTTAEQKTRPERTEVSIRTIRVDRRQLECKSAPCAELLTVFAEISNTSAKAVGELELAVGLFWQEGSIEPVLPADFATLKANERRVRLNDSQILLPGESKRMRLNIDREVPQIPGGAFVPHVRLLHSRYYD